MKAPSKSMAKSLASQAVPGRGQEAVVVTQQRPLGELTATGEGGVVDAPGARHERSAANYCDPMRRFGG